MMIWRDDHMTGWGYGLMTISMVAFWTLIIAGIVLLVRYLGRADRQAGPVAEQRPTPQQLLGERYARGEIDEEEYRRRLDTLGGVSRS